MLDWQVFRARLPLKMEFILFISFIPADAWFSIGCVKAVQYMLCVAGMSCTSLGVFALFFFLKSPSTGDLSAVQNSADMRFVCKTEMHFHILSHGFPNKDVYRKKKKKKKALMLY